MSLSTPPPLLIRRWTADPEGLRAVRTSDLARILAPGPRGYANVPGYWEAMAPAVRAELQRRRREGP